ncbi:MAG: PAS domain S-box protein [Bacteroidota bacterium]|jgi:PAS domain S-box-containing protein
MEMKPLTILAIDENADIFSSISATIQSLLPGTRMMYSAGRTDGIYWTEADTPDIVFLSFANQPESCLDICRGLKSDARSYHVPVFVLITDASEKALRLKAFDAGADGFLKEPCDEIDLLLLIRAHTRKTSNRGVPTDATERQVHDERSRSQGLIEVLKEHHEKVEVLRESNIRLEDGQRATLNLLEDLKNEVEARKQSEIALRRSEENFKMAQRVAHVGSWIWHIQINTLEWSDQMYAIFGMEKEDFSGDLTDIIARAIHPDDKAKVEAANLAVMERAHTSPLEYRIMRPDGSVRYVWAEAGELVVDEAGIPTTLSGVIQDITDLRKSERSLRESRERFDLAMHATSDGLYDWNLLTNEIYYSPSWKAMLGYREDELPNDFSVWERLTHPDDVTLSWSMLEELLTRKRSRFILEFRMLHKEGHWVDILSRADAIFDDNGKPVRVVGTHVDISESKRATEALHDSEQRIRAITESAQDAIVMIDETGIITYWNPAAGHIFGYTEDEAIGKNPHLFIASENERDNSMSAFMAYTSSGQGAGLGKTLELTGVRKDGRHIDISLSLSAVELKGKWHAVSIIRDITDWKLTEVRLRESEALFRALFEGHAAVKMLVNPETGAIVDVNQAAVEFYGWSREELTHMRVQQLNTLPEAEVNRVLLQTKLSQRSHYEFQHRLADGSIRDVEIFAGAITIKGKSLIHSIVQDVTNKKEAERQIKLLGHSVEQSPVSIVITNLEGEIIYINPEFTKVTGYLRDEVLGQNSRILNSGEQSGVFYTDMWNTILSGQNWIGEFHNRKKDGTLYWESAVISPVMDDNNRITHFIGIKTDITAQKQLLADLVAEKERAEESDRLKSTFLANMSHEVRTPMNAIIGFSDLLTDKDLNREDQTLYTEIIRQRSYDLLGIINDILNISLLDAGEVKIFEEKGNIEEILQDLYQSFIPLLKIEKAEHVRLICHVDIPESAKTVLLDVGRLRQVLTNLLSNAFKFTDDGIITFGCQLYNDEELKFYVSDTGIGIPQEAQQYIFNRFRQVDESTTRRYGGTGLGLSISKGLVELMGGELTVVSSPGAGSTFEFSLPFHPVNTERG